MLKAAAFVFIVVQGIFLTVKTDSDFPRFSETNIDDCFCLYDGAGTLVKAEIEGKFLKNMDRVRKGETVTFKCMAFDSLSWQNGLHIYGNAEVTCTTCERWKRKDNPNCNLAGIGNPFIVLDEKIKLLPSGVAEIQVGKAINLTCSSTIHYPQWYFQGKPVPSEDRYIPAFKLIKLVEEDVELFSTSFNLTVIGEENGGIYECILSNNSAYLDGRTVLDLRVKGEKSFYTKTEQSAWFTKSIGHTLPRSKRSLKSPSLKGSSTTSSNSTQYDGIALFWEKNIAFLRNGTIKIRKGQNTSFKCVAVEGNRYPKWNTPDESGISYKWATRKYENGHNYITYLYIQNADYHNEGQYDCFIGNGPQVTTHVIVFDPDLRCPELKEGYEMIIEYDNDRREGSKASFSCFEDEQELVGDAILTCLRTKEWSHPEPYCIGITCPLFLFDEDLTIDLTNSNKVFSVATFSCPSYAKMVGLNISICLPNGEWIYPQPRCIDNVKCSEFPNLPGMVISYSKGVSVKSIAVFSCISPLTLVGEPHATCKPNGEWSHPVPFCEDVQECILELNDNSHLLIQPKKDNYRFGEMVILSCPPGEKLTNNIQRLTCYGRNTWSEPIPDCEKSPQKD